MKYKITTFFIACIVLTQSMFVEGFLAGTLVKTFDYTIPIEEIRIGDTV